jgi:polyphosphate kinase
MKLKPEHFFNRELSWIDFNQRVLEEAKNETNPLLERLKFLAITASNLDEFFMVRVGGLQMLRKADRRKADASGLTPRQQLAAIGKRVRQMNAEQDLCFQELEQQLSKAGIRQLKMNGLNIEQQQTVDRFFNEELLPVLSPIALEAGAPAPAFRNLQPYLLIRLAGEEADRYATLALGAPFGRFFELPCDSGGESILLEDIVRAHISRWFTGFDIKETVLFRITRNADVAVREDEAGDLLAGMTTVLEERQWADCVRIEVEAAASRDARSRLCELLDADHKDIYPVSSRLNLKDFMELSFITGFVNLKAEAQHPQIPPQIDRQEPMFDQIAEQSILLYHPYESFDPVIRFIREAAADPDVLAIKQVLYRTSTDSPIIAALADAARAGKAVTALVELKARFDEHRNIGWSRQLEKAGVQIVYGVRGLKTHAKVCLVVRREPQGIVRYVHYGTGNYNDSTARLYGDISYFTCDEDLGADAVQLFHAVCGFSQPAGLRKAGMAPLNLRDKLIQQIDGEIEHARQKQKARIRVKINSLVDTALIEKLYEASRAGVQIQLNVRGVCCLRPGVPKLSENITVTSIISRYLEHARIICFHNGGDEKLTISSADWMPRNLDRRVELLIPVEDPRSRRRLLEILKIHCSDNVKSWTLLSDGSYVRTGTLSGRKKKIDSQQFFYDQACEAVAEAAKRSRTALRPHRPHKES